MRKLRLRTRLCLSLVCTCSVSARLVCAAPAVHASGEDGTVAIARERFKAGVVFFDKKEFDKARVAFLQAYALKKHPAVLLNLAQSELRSAHEADAAKHFSAYLREATDATGAETQAAQAGLNAAKLAVCEVDVNVDESGAEVSVDGTLEGMSPLPGAVYLTAGQHTVEAHKGARSSATQVGASAGKELTLTLALSTKLAPAAPPAEVAPAERAAPPPVLEHAPELELPASDSDEGRKPFFQWLTSSPVGLAGLSLTGVGVGSGIGFAIASNKSYSSSDSVAQQINQAAIMDSGSAMPNTTDLCSDPKAWLSGVGYDASDKKPNIDQRTAQYAHACTKYPENVHRGDTFKAISKVGFVIGGVAAVATVLYYFVDPNAKEAARDAKAGRRRVAIMPSVGPRQTGLTVAGSF